MLLCRVCESERLGDGFVSFRLRSSPVCLVNICVSDEYCVMFLIPHPYIGAFLFIVLRIVRISRRRHLHICGSVFVDAHLCRDVRV
jgi:hypothetical protein